MFSHTRPPKEMPWDDLIWVFLREAKTRIAQIKQSLITEPVSQLREYRVLTLGGPRQTGKSVVGQQAVKQREWARLIVRTAPGGEGVAYLNLHEKVEARRLELHQLVQSKLEGVTVLVIDNNGYPVDTASPYHAVEKLYHQHPEWFHPEFSIIHIL